MQSETSVCPCLSKQRHRKSTIHRPKVRYIYFSVKSNMSRTMALYKYMGIVWSSGCNTYVNINVRSILYREFYHDTV